MWSRYTQCRPQPLHMKRREFRSRLVEGVGALVRDHQRRQLLDRYGVSVPARRKHRIRASSEPSPSLVQAAAEAHISPSRLTHLFTGEVGIPFRRYGLWVRLRRAAEHVAGGTNLTRAAVAAGFSDSAHLSRAFKTNFGLSPSALFGMKLYRGAWPEDTSTRDCPNTTEEISRKVQGIRTCGT